MSLQIVYGKSGSGKSTYLYDQIKEKIKDDNKIYIITPEQFSYTAEQKLLEVVPNGAVLNAEVLTFNRMAYRVIQEVGGRTKTNLNSCGSSMLIYSILQEEKKNLKFLGKSDENIEIVGNAITEFKKHRISPNELENVINSSDNLYLKAKLNDIETIYKNYQLQIENNFIDENDTLDLLIEKLDKTDMFKNCLIYIDEFVGFTMQEYEVIEKLLKQANKITIFMCSDELENRRSIDQDIFYANKQTIDRLLKLAKDNNEKVEKEIYLDKQYRFKTNQTKHLEENLYKIPYKKYQEKVENISLFLAQNAYSEIEKIAKQIVKLVRDENYRYKDISVITKNLEIYSSLIKVIYSKYNIPVFIDEKRDLSQNILVKYILSVLDIFSKNWTLEAVIAYGKSGFLEIENEEIFALENYCIKWDIKRSKWYKEDWIFGENEEEKAKLNEIRKLIVEPLLELKNNLSKTKTVKEITKVLYEFLIKNKINIKLEDKINKLYNDENIELAKEYETGYNTVISVFDEITLVFGDKKISFDEYSKLLKIGFNKTPIGKIPPIEDCVVVGDVDRSRTHKVKSVFIIGLNDGVFPSINKEEGFLDDKDRENLKQNGIELAKGTVEKMYEDNFNIYKAFSAAEEKIYLSYVASDLAGKSLRPSILVAKIKKIFPMLKQTSDLIERKSEILTSKNSFEELLYNLNEFKQGKQIDKIWFSVFNYIYNSDKKEKLEKALKALDYTNEPEKISKQNIENLYGDNLKTSISKLEKFKACPFSYYLQYGLKLEEKENFKIEMIDTGSFMHEVIDKFFNTIKEDNKNIREISDEQLYKIIEDIINDKLKLNKNYIFTSTPKYKILANKLKKVVLKSMKYIIESIKNSSFDVIGNEVEFKNGKEYSPITLNLENGKTVEITGKIDRIDLAQNEERKIYKNNRL